METVYFKPWTLAMNLDKQEAKTFPGDRVTVDKLPPSWEGDRLRFTVFPRVTLASLFPAS
jgi:hypothetical protein